MKISIKTLKKEKFDLEVADSDTVLALKKRIESELQLGDADGQKLIHSGKILKDDQTMAAAGIKDGDFLVVMVSSTKAKPPAPAPKPAAPAPAAPASAAASAAPSAPAPSAAAPAAPASSAPAPAGGRLDQAAASNLVVGGPQVEDMIVNLMALGFPRDQVQAALRASFNNPDRAAQFLFSGEIPQQPVAPPAQARAGGGGGGGHGHAHGPGGHGHAHAHGPGGHDDDGEGDDEGDAMDDGEGDGEGDYGDDGEDEAMGGPLGLPEELRAQLAANPQLIPLLLNQLAMSNPGMLEQIGIQSPEDLAALLGQQAGGGGGGGGGLGGAVPRGGGGGGGGGGMSIQVTPEEKAAIERLKALGFTEAQVVEAWLACDRNEELAANYLFDNQGN